MNGHPSGDHERSLLDDVRAADGNPLRNGTRTALSSKGCSSILLYLNPRRPFICDVFVVRLRLQGGGGILPASNGPAGGVADTSLLVDVLGDNYLRGL